MGRVIKFRAWDKDDKKMWKVVGFSEPIWGDCEETHVTICDFDKSPLNKETDVRASFNYELMQFTGLIDRNGKEIYEGDIVDYGADYSVVRYQDGCFWSRLGQYQLYNHNKNDIEVIGNIYENSDLLATT